MAEDHGFQKGWIVLAQYASKATVPRAIIALLEEPLFRSATTIV
jgi:hypothetical protein